jgi:methionine synthase II (cobalamin-independent)
MALSTQCGFASVAAGNPIAFETQRAKLKLVADVARRTGNDAAAFGGLTLAP